jgi:hypothetical protein
MSASSYPEPVLIQMVAFPIAGVRAAGTGFGEITAHPHGDVRRLIYLAT